MLRLSALSVVCAASLAQAQIPIPTQPPTPVPITAMPVLVDSSPTFERPNGSLMRTGSLTYTLSLTRPNGQITPLGTRTVSVSETTIGGTQGWLVAEARIGTVVESTDSVSLARADLSPARWSATIGRSQFGASFTRDSVFGAIVTYQGQSSFAMALPPGTLLSAGMVEHVIELLPLRAGYRASASLMIVDGPSPRALPAAIVVDREERVDGIDSWVVSVRAGAIEQRLWVSKSGARVLRTEQAVTDGILASVLQP
ncbi:MAG: hypothetical protein ABIT20_08535 [Gemmatimonadaceae bacterium]